MTDVATADPSGQADGVLLLPLDQPEPLASGWAPLDDRGLIAASGDDAVAFLQGQLTQDMARVQAGLPLLAAHCTAKGRVASLLHALPAGDTLLLDLPGPLEAAALRRLRLYVLRAKVVLSPAAAHWSRIGLHGADTPGWLAQAGLPCPVAGEPVAVADDLRVAAWPGSRWIVYGPQGGLQALAVRLAAEGAPDRTGWLRAGLRAGLPEVLPETTELFIPQMLNLDQLDAISFRKGCYTGQEVVARAHYLGRVKRRLQAWRWTGPGEPAPGARLTLPAAPEGADRAVSAAAASTPADPTEGGSVAEVVLACTTGPGQGELLAVVRAPEPAAGTTPA